MNTIDRAQCYFTSFITGYVMLSLEILGFRLFAPYFGYSLYVSGSLIGVILLALSLGYSLGGYASDHRAGTRSVFAVLFTSGIYLLFVERYHDIVLQKFFNLSIITGSLTATLVLLAPPMILLASLSPYFITILSVEQKRGVGVSAGSIFTVSTVGSLLGTFLTSFYSVPEFGVAKTLSANAFILLVLSVFWFSGKNRSMVGVSVAAVLFLSINAGNDSFPPKVLAETDSVYSHLEVVDYGPFLGLRTDRRNNLVYSLYPKDGIWRGDLSFYHLFAVPPLINNAKTSLLLGLGAGSIPLIQSEINPTLDITGVEIDPKIVEIGSKYFGLKERSNTRIIIADARPFLMKDRGRYDFIETDLFQGSGEVPFYLATKEFFALTREHLTERGIFAMNIYDPSNDKKILRPLINTVASVYPYAYFVPFRDGSYFLLGTNMPITYEHLDQELASHTFDSRFLDIVSTFKKGLILMFFAPKDPVFTDNLAPLEKLSYEAIFRER